MSKMERILLPLLLVWLVTWIAISWPAIQDDALIHLRYADNLYVHHFITYDGVHASYGASSLLYVGVLAGLRGFTTSPNLPRAVSSAMHLLLFSGLAYGFLLRLPKTARLARLAGLVLLCLTATPSAVRWLDDGMETVLAVSFVSLFVWLIHRQCEAARTEQRSISASGYFFMAVFSFAAVLLRTELLLVCSIGFLILTFTVAKPRPDATLAPAHLTRAALESSHLLVGGALAMALIFSTMHVLLPDTAVAKSQGIVKWFNPVRDTATTLGGAFSFGIGLLLFWLLTLLLAAVREGRPRPATLLANSFCPVVLALAALRGQEIQGARYFAWTFFFAIIWNILELARPGRDVFVANGGIALSVFVALLLIDLPFESLAMHHVLTQRAATMRSFEAQHLDVLRAQRGVASDIGYIGYFTGADICDLAGLVNGRPTARMSSIERAHACLGTDPDFLFGNRSQLVPLTRMADLSGWQICGQYDFTNLRTPDTHFLIVRPTISEEVCRATGAAARPVSDLL
jgi:hypothetical protein